MRSAVELTWLIFTEMHQLTTWLTWPQLVSVNEDEYRSSFELAVTITWLREWVWEARTRVLGLYCSANANAKPETFIIQRLQWLAADNEFITV